MTLGTPAPGFGVRNQEQKVRDFAMPDHGLRPKHRVIATAATANRRIRG
jgi:hypothetical protein